MRKVNRPWLKGIAVLSLILCSKLSINAQSQLDWGRDTIAADKANGSHIAFINGMRKPTTYVNFDANKLKAIVDRCVANGITNIQFMISTIRKEDTAQYVKNLAGITTQERDDLIGRQYLIIKLPKDQFYGSGAKAKSTTINAMVLAMLGPGLIYLENLEGLNPASGSVYLGVGIICPPPASCN